MEESSRVRVRGPLAEHAPTFVRWLTELGYADRTVAGHVRRLAHLSRWLGDTGLDRSAVDEALVATVVGSLGRRGAWSKLTVSSFRLVLQFLREQGIAPAASRPPSPFDALLADYRRYLEADRGLAPLTLPSYLGSASWFLADTCGDDPRHVQALSAAHVASFVLAVTKVRQPASVNTVVVGVRSLLRWLHLVGLIGAPLAQATPWLAGGSTSTPPRTLPVGHAGLLVASCDPSTSVGARDLAVVTVLVRLGLRAGEVAGLSLDDLDWRRGEVNVRGKGGWRDPLPLPVDVGEALVGYLRLRSGRAGVRNLFLQVRAPHGPMTMSSVRAVVRRACERAGIADTGTHRIRHGAAADMLRHGAPLHEIGQVLRHHDLATTARYAKVDFDALAMVARAWPGSGR